MANLTLMALGSSAPEILLSVIEIVGNGEAHIYTQTHSCAPLADKM